MLEWLLKHPLASFRDAEWIFESGRSAELLLIILAVLLVLIALSLWRAGSQVSSHNRTGHRSALFFRLFGIGCLQAIFAGILLLMFWQPALKVDSVASGDNAVAMLIDNSRSMYFDAGQGAIVNTTDDSVSPAETTRLGQTMAAVRSSGLTEELQRNFDLKLFRLDTDSTETEDSVVSGKPAENPPLLEHLIETLESGRDQALAGVILATDGAIDSANLDAAWWRQLAAYGIPVYPLLSGETALPGEVELSQVDVPAVATPGSAVPVTVTVTYDLPVKADENSTDDSSSDPVVAQSGAGHNYHTTLRIFNGQALLLVEDIPLPMNQQQVSHIAEFNAPDSGLLDLRFELKGLQSTDSDQQSSAPTKEAHTANNLQRRLLPVSGEPRRVLYIEGEPRWEYKFIRRALSSYPGVELVSLLRTSPNKLYRQGVRDERELVDGFPASKEELFSYDALIIGSLEAAYLNAEQQRSIRQFVRERGGSLLMLAGKNGLADGGWGRTEVAQALPAVLEGASSQTFKRQRRTVQPTALGEQTDWLALSAVAEDNLDAWAGLPEIADVQSLGELKPGASVLLQTIAETPQIDAEPLLMWQRYGRGKSYLLATSGTWRWQMSLPSDDERHELFWQGFTGHLVDGVLPRLAVSVDQAVYLDQSQVKLQLDWRDEGFQPSSDASVSVEVISPTGVASALELLPHESIVGRFESTLAAVEPGAWQVNVNVTGDDEASQSIWFMREDERAEDFGLRSNDALMQRIAQETGGQVARNNEIAELPAMLGNSEALLVRHSALPLWNMPLFFLLLLFSKLFEWLLRWHWGRI